ncbi:peptidoglycan DD-metalloendopeptidase family protein [Patescibacteria group bacterium]|nr:peptidoglycan DD-metalloendopeptidase family protein [Patescibacteria group bacterium]
MEPIGKKQQILLILACFALTMFANSTLIMAVNSADTGQIAQTAGATATETPAQEPVDSNVDPNQQMRDQFLENIKTEIRSNEKELFDINANLADAKGRLDVVHEEITTLAVQLANLDYQIKTTEQLINNVSVQIAQKENEIAFLYNEIDIKNAEIENQKRILLEYLETLYTQESAITDTMADNSDINIAKLLLSDEPIGEQLQRITYFNIMEKTGHEIFDKLASLALVLENDKELAKVAKDRLSKLYARLEEEKSNLDIQRQAKANLLEQTRGEEEIYRNLVEETKKQEAQVHSDLMEMRDNMAFIAEEMRVLGDKFNPDDYRDLFSGERTSIYAYINAFKDVNSAFRPLWPVSPERGISAYFHDSSYRAFFGIEHYAIDIPTSQKSTVRAPAEGVVYKARDNGFGYSYLILAHKGGYMTVYGHIFEFLVEPGEKVRAGQAIALSGGTPGTKGAGYMTTGAHLHFEVIKGDKHVDPLLYLSLAALDYSSLPKQYQLLADNQQEHKVKRTAEVLPQTQSLPDAAAP